MFLATIATATLCFLLRGSILSNRTANGVTTETVAAEAGAQVLPTDPKLKV